MTTTDALATTLDQTAFALEWEDWHRAHEARRADPEGLLAVTAVHWLDQTPRRLDGVPGVWSTGDDGPVVELSADEELEQDGVRIIHRHAFGPIAERAGVTVRSGDVVIEVARRGGQDIVRPRDPAHPYLARFRGTPTYAPDPRWVAHGRFRPFGSPREVTVGSAAEGLQHVYAAPGEVEFELGGEVFRLIAFNGHAPGTLTVLFTDATSGLTTYAANRSLDIAAPDAAGALTLDFHRAVNLPCAYTDHATCPLPPAENRLTVGIEAGEQTPLQRHRA
jgi:hypothetical protein